MRLAIVTPEGEVKNVIEAESDFNPGEGRSAIAATGSVSPGWSWDGNRFTEPVVETPMPVSVSDLQFRMALNMMGLRVAAEAVVANGPQSLRDYWDRALIIHRAHPFVSEAAKAMGKSSAEIDDLFRLAATL